MSIIEHIHGKYVHKRRVRVLSDTLAELIPPDARVLDVGCGDGLLARLLMDKRADVEIRGIDTLVRGQTHIPVDGFDGRLLPYDDASFDVVMFVDVLHHTETQIILLREAARVAGQAIVIKDHLCDGVFARPTLRLMDRVGNARYGIALPYNYWSQQQWVQAFDLLGLSVQVWKSNLQLYPGFVNWIFGRSFHFIARLCVQNAAGI